MTKDSPPLRECRELFEEWLADNGTYKDGEDDCWELWQEAWQASRIESPKPSVIEEQTIGCSEHHYWNVDCTECHKEYFKHTVKENVSGVVGNLRVLRTQLLFRPVDEAIIAQMNEIIDASVAALESIKGENNE